MIGAVERMRKSTVVVLVKTDEIDHLFKMVDYVRKNEETSSIKLVHFCGDNMVDVPTELDANSKILDETFPQITIDLIFIQASFAPANVICASNKLGVPLSQFFLSCPGSGSRESFIEIGLRIVTL